MNVETIIKRTAQLLFYK